MSKKNQWLLRCAWVLLLVMVIACAGCSCDDDDDDNDDNDNNNNDDNDDNDDVTDDDGIDDDDADDDDGDDDDGDDDDDDDMNPGEFIAEGANISLAVEADGTPHVVFFGEFDVVHAERIDGVWQNENLPTAPWLRGNNGAPVEVDGDGDVLVAVMERGDYIDGHRLMYYRRHDDAWVFEIVQDGIDEYYAYVRAFDLDRNDVPHIVYFVEWYVGEDPNYEHRYATKDGADWRVERIAEGYGSDEADIASETGVAHVLYGRRNYATNVSGFWESEFIDHYGAIDCGVDDLPQVATYFGYGRRDPEGTWDFVDLGEPGSRQDEAIAVERNGAAHVAYIQWSNQVDYFTNQSGDWKMREIAGPTSEGIGGVDIEIAVDDAGGVHFVWVHNYDQIYYYYLPPE